MTKLCNHLMFTMETMLLYVQRKISGYFPLGWDRAVFQRFLVRLLWQGRIPRHVAFIMDGNRRYASIHGFQVAIGHLHGAEAYLEILDFSLACGIGAVTAYMFSIENTKRPDEQLSQIISLTSRYLDKIVAIAEHYGASIRSPGQRELLPPQLKDYLDAAIAKTQYNTRAVVNICFLYTSRAEITTAIRSTVDEYSMRNKGEIEESESPSGNTRTDNCTQALATQIDPVNELYTSHSPSTDTSVDVELDATRRHSQEDKMKAPSCDNSSVDADSIVSSSIERHLYTADNPPLDILIRTSGVERLSDFMLWQCHRDTHISFIDCHWPQINCIHLAKVILSWQFRRACSES